MDIGALIGIKRKVLLVEDDVQLRRALKEQFEHAGYQVYEAGDAQEVLGLVESVHPSAIVLDLILPIKDGITLLEEIRMGGCTVPVIILSNLLGSGDLRSDAERLGAAFFNKSSTALDTIVQSISDALDK